MHAHLVGVALYCIACAALKYGLRSTVALLLLLRRRLLAIARLYHHLQHPVLL